MSSFSNFKLMDIKNICTQRYLVLCSLMISIMIVESCSKKNNENNSTGSNTNVINAGVTVLANENNQIIQGFGCATVFAAPNTTP